MRMKMNTAKCEGKRQQSMGLGFGNLGLWWEPAGSGLPAPFGDQRMDVNMAWKHKLGMGRPGSVLKNWGVKIQGDAACGKSWQLGRAGRAPGWFVEGEMLKSRTPPGIPLGILEVVGARTIKSYSGVWSSAWQCLLGPGPRTWTRGCQTSSRHEFPGVLRLLSLLPTDPDPAWPYEGTEPVIGAPGRSFGMESWAAPSPGWFLHVESQNWRITE